MKRKADEEFTAQQMLIFAEELDNIYLIRDDDPDLKIEDIIDDIAVDALELHDSDESGADLELDNLSLDELEEDAIPDDPLQQSSNIIAFEFIGLGPKKGLPPTIGKTTAPTSSKSDPVMSMYSVKGKSQQPPPSP